MDEKKAITILAAGILMFVLLFGGYLYYKSTQSLTLTITDENGNPIGSALVELFDENGKKIGEAVTDENGNATFPGVDPNGKYTYKVTRNGFDDKIGTYNPDDPDGKIIKLGKPKSPELSFDNPPKLPPVATPRPRNIIPGGGTDGASPTPPGQGIEGGNPSPASRPRPPTHYVVDGKLTVTVKNKASSQTIGNAVVTLYDGATGTFLAQGSTENDGTLSFGVKQGSTISIQARKQGYVASDVLSVAIDAAEVSAEVLLVAEGVDTGQSQINVVDSQGQPVEGARVQVFASPALIDQVTQQSGRIDLTMEKGKTYGVLATKTGFKDASAQFQPGNDVTLTLEAYPAGTQMAKLTVTVKNHDGTPAQKARVAVLKKVFDKTITYYTQTADDSGIARFFEPPLSLFDVRVSATAASGEPSTTKDITLASGDNTVTLDLPAPTEPPIRVPTGGTPKKVCLNQGLELPSEADESSYNYSLKDIANDRAVFQVERFGDADPQTGVRPTAVACSTYSAACTYVLGQYSKDNDALSTSTGVTVRLTAVDLIGKCVTINVGNEACQGENCACGTQGPAVCGGDGVTYVNSCEAEKNGATPWSQGACTTQCIAQYAPVCFQETQQFSNACEARKAGAIPYVPGECPPPIPKKTIQVPAGFSAIGPLGDGPLLSTTCRDPDGKYLFFQYVQSQGNWNRLNQNQLPALTYPDGYLAYGEQTCKLTFEDKPAASYAPVLTKGWNFIAGPPQSATFNQIRGSCPAYQGTGSAQIEATRELSFADTAFTITKTLELTPPQMIIDPLVVDSDGVYAYGVLREGGTTSLPKKIVKINLETLTIQNQVSVPENAGWGGDLVYHEQSQSVLYIINRNPANNFGGFGGETYTDAYRFRATDLVQTTTKHFDGSNILNAKAIGQHLYALHQGKITKFDPNTLNIVAQGQALADNELANAVTDGVNLYTGSSVLGERDPKKINVQTLAITKLASTSAGIPVAAVSDQTGGLVYYVHNGALVKRRASDFTVLASAQVPNAISAVVDANNDIAYVLGSQSGWTGIRLSDMTVIGQYAYPQDAQGFVLAPGGKGYASVSGQYSLQTGTWTRTGKLHELSLPNAATTTPSPTPSPSLGPTPTVTPGTATPSPTPSPGASPTPTPAPDVFVMTAQGVSSDTGDFVKVDPATPLEPGQGYMIYYHGTAGDTCTLGAPQTSTFNLELERGWNFVSVPLTDAAYQSDTCDFASQPENARNQPAWHFDGTQYQSAGKLSDGSIRTDHGKAYWVYSDVACTATFTGVPYSAYNQYALRGGGNPPTTPAGWNMIGALNQPTEFDRVRNNCAIIGTGLFWYNATTGGYRTATTIEPGRGYWAFIQQDCQLNGGPASSPSTASVPPALGQPPQIPPLPESTTSSPTPSPSPTPPPSLTGEAIVYLYSCRWYQENNADDTWYTHAWNPEDCTGDTGLPKDHDQCSYGVRQASHGSGRPSSFEVSTDQIRFYNPKFERQFSMTADYICTDNPKPQGIYQYSCRWVQQNAADNTWYQHDWVAGDCTGDAGLPKDHTQCAAFVSEAQQGSGRFSNFVASKTNIRGYNSLNERTIAITTRYFCYDEKPSNLAKYSCRWAPQNMADNTWNTNAWTNTQCGGQGKPADHAACALAASEVGQGSGRPPGFSMDKTQAQLYNSLNERQGSLAADFLCRNA